MNSDVLDANKLQELKMLMGPQFPELIDTFKRNAETKLVQITTAIVQEDRDEILRSAHGLKGSSGNLGANALYHLCENLEAMSMECSLIHAQQKFKEIEDEYEKLREVLQKLI